MGDPPGDLKNLLGPDEQMQLFIEQKIYHPKINVDSIVITNQRIILRHPHALRLKKDYTDFNYRDISNVILDKGILRSTVQCTLRLGGDPLSLSDLPNSEAEKAYAIIRENLNRFQSPLTMGYGAVPGYVAPSQVQPQAAPVRVCPKCGTPLGPGQSFCGSCGASVK